MFPRLVRLYRYKLNKKYEIARYGKHRIDNSRIPEPLREIVTNNEYVAASPYPVERLVEEFKTTPFITRETRILTMGSCFADELNKWLQRNQYQVLKNIWGAVFTPQSFAQIIRYSFEPENWNPVEPFWIIDGKYYYPYLKSSFGTGMLLGDNEAEANQNLRRHFQESAEKLGEAELAVWTLGLVELWRNRQDHATYFQLPTAEIYDPNIHEFHCLTYEEVMEHMRYSISTYKKHNPGLKILLSVSPIPLRVTFREQLGPYIATQYSKSVLHAAALRLTEEYRDVYYMPSYEITRMNPALYYKQDGRHVNELCVDTVMDIFQKLYIEA